MNWKIWIAVPVLYGVFSLWYFNWQGPLTQEEIDQYVATFADRDGMAHTDAAVFRRFLEEDDGKEFVMLNLVELRPGELEHPKTGQLMEAGDVLIDYVEPFVKELLKRGGHPVFQARRVGGDIDSWNADDNVSFSSVAMMRYRSRRDLVELALSPDFPDSHVYKLAAIDRTISYPTQIVLSSSIRPPLALLLLLLLLASLAQNLTRRR